MICASILTALGLVLGKQALAELPVWLVFSMRKLWHGHGLSHLVEARRLGRAVQVNA